MPVLRGVGEGLAVVLMATAVKLTLWHWLGAESPESLYVAAIALATVRGRGWGAGAAIALSFALGAVLFSEPYGQAVVQRPETAAHLLALLLEGSAVALVVLAFMRARATRTGLPAETIDPREVDLRAAGIAHDVSNLLAVIVPCIDIGRRAVEPDSMAARALADAQIAGMRAGRLARRLMRPSPRFDLDEGVDLNELVDGFVRIASRIGGERVELTLRPHAAPVRVACDESELEQVLLNLVVNACEAMSDGGRLCIEVGRVERESGRWAALRVHDSGHGIDSRAAPHVFEPFFSTKEGGNGVGMAVAAEIVRRCRGRIEIERTGADGTVIAVLLPEMEVGGPR